MNSSVPCLVCHSPLELRLARGRKSQKPFLMLVCPIDGRHFRGFISDRQFVGKALARLKVTQRKGFAHRFGAILERVYAGQLSRRRAAKELGIGYATLKRLLDQHLGDEVEQEG